VVEKVRQNGLRTWLNGMRDGEIVIF